MRFLRRSLVGLFLMGLTLGILAYAGNMVRGAVQERLAQEPRSFPQRERVIAVNVVPYVAETLTPELNVFGELLARQTLAVRTSANGTVTEVSPNFIEGGQVQAGDVLLRIDPVTAQEALARVQADMRDAEAGVRDADRALILARDELAAAEVQAELRLQALQRQQDLQDRGVGTAPALEAAELAVSTANQTVLSRRQGVANAEAAIDQAASTRARVQINLAEAERRLADTTLVAAFDGTLTGVSTAPGALVTANEQVAELVDPTALEASFRLSTSQYATLAASGALIGAPVQVTLDVSGVDLVAEGAISRVSATVGEGQTGRVIFAQLEDVQGFRPGDFVTVRVEEPAMDGVARVPASALAADNSVLAVTSENRLREVEVELLRRQGNDVLIRARQLTGQSIVAERTPLLGAGIAVEPIVPGGAEVADGPEMIVLEPERRDRLIAAIEGNAYIPADAKERILGQLRQPEVPAAVVERIEARMGG